MEIKFAQDVLFSNGVNAATGEYDIPPLDPETLAAIIQGEAPPEALEELRLKAADAPSYRYASPDNLNELRYRYQQQTIQHLGVKAAIDAADLSQAGWGIIFAQDADPLIREALSELIDLRRGQAGEYFRLYEGDKGYRPGESKSKFLARHGAGPGPADPDKVPYYLLLVGSPDVIPYRFQTELDVQYAVGRIHFETAQEYANYARSVVHSETRVRLPRSLAFFAPTSDPASQLSQEYLALPLYESLKSEMVHHQGQAAWRYRALWGDQAQKANLASLLGGDETPAFLFSATHGVTFPQDHPLQLRHQGALLCQNWPGPESWKQPIPQDFYFAADDLDESSNLLGLIAFFHATYGGGTPRTDAFSRQAFSTAREEASHAFVARLPQAMLSRPRGGALAVIGQVERVSGFPFGWPGISGQSAVYESAIRQILSGSRVGMAVEFFNERYAELSTVLSDGLEEIDFGKTADPYELAGLWVANNDARSYAIFGDPAVRLPLAADEDELSAPALEPVRIDTGGGREVATPAEGSPAIPPLGDRPSLQELAPDNGQIPAFVRQIRSEEPEIRQRAIAAAVEIVRKAGIAFEQAAEKAKQDGETELAFSDEDRAIFEQQKALNKEIRRQTAIVENPQARQRRNAVPILRDLGPLAKSGALPAIRELLERDPDLGFRATLVEAVVAIEDDRPALLRELRKQLRENQPPVQAAVMAALVELDPPPVEALNELWAMAADEELGALALQTIFAIQQDHSQLVADVMGRLRDGRLAEERARAVTGGLLVGEPVALAAAWQDGKENKMLLLELLQATLAVGGEAERRRTVEWLVQRIDEVPGEMLDQMVTELKQLSLTDEDPATQRQIMDLSEKLASRKKAERMWLLRDLRSKDSSVQIEAIKRAAETDDEWALRILIQVWVQWIASGKSENTQLVEEAAEKMRYNPLAVLPLVNHLTQEFQPSDELVRSASEAMAQKQEEGRSLDDPATATPTLQAKIDQLLRQELDTREWNIHQRILRQMSASEHVELDDETLHKNIVALIEAEFKERELRVRQRIARQLADMSNPNYFDKADTQYERIRSSLEKYGVPVLARMLPEAADDEIRKHLAYTLGNVGGRESVDALARAVVGEERTRANRQRLLAEYYLDPSRRRSDEASEILKGAVEEARRTLRLQQWLNIAVFIVGLILLVGGITVAVLGEDYTRIAGILAGLGGFLGVVIELVNRPLERIQTAMANLVQLETAFTSFIWELNLNGTYIQSQYVAEGILTDDDIAQTVGRIEDAMNLTMNQVALYTHKGHQLLTPRIIALTPQLGQAGTVITVFGQHLKTSRNPARKRSQQLTIAVNHVPVASRDLSNNSEYVRFELPSVTSAIGQGTDTVWVSLIVDGTETNALPFHLQNEGI